MKITTRIISGYGLLIALLAVLVIYQVIMINRMQSINRTLSRINFQSALTCLQLLRDRDLVEEYARKSFALGDPDYINQLKGYQTDFETTVKQLKSEVSPSDEQSSVKRLSQIWESFTVDLRLRQLDVHRGGSALPESLQDDLERLRAEIYTVYDSILQTISSEVERSRRTGETASLVLWCSALAALVIAIVVSFLIFRSISIPLAHLTDGTRAIAEGRFFYRLDSSRNDEFSELAKDFNTMSRRLNELNELKKDFVSHVSHELKAPLASMRETIQLMLEEIPGPLTGKQKRLLELNLKSGYRLTSMIGNLLDVSKMEAGVMEYELKDHDLVSLVQTSLAELEGQASERGVQIETDFPNKPLSVECDGDRIIQVIVNLIGNAVKFSPKGGVVQVQVEASAEVHRKVPERWRHLVPKNDGEINFGLVRITDSGPGVPDAHKEKVFERFHQVRQGKKISGQGVGLGLAICRTIVEAHRGAIWVDDKPGGGSTFSLLLRSGNREKDAVACASLPI